MDEKANKIAIATEASNVLIRHLMAHSLSFVYCSSDSPKDWSISSGTLVVIGGRVFVCTASHCVERQGGSVDNYVVIDGRRRRIPGNSIVIAHHGVEGHSPDVGILEVDPVLINDYGKTPIGLERICNYGIGRPGRLSFLVGTPSEMISINEETKTIVGSVIGYVGLPIDEGDGFWSNPEWNPDKNVDVWQEYPAGRGQTIRFDTKEKTELPNPGGMSGGGLWDMGFDNGAWYPDRSRLFAIQVSWLPQSRYLKGVQITYWLKLVYERYPDLRLILEGKFPELKNR